MVEVRRVERTEEEIWRGELISWPVLGGECVVLLS